MKLLCLSDLHLRQNDVIQTIDNNNLSPFLQEVKSLIANENLDTIALTGDTVSPLQIRLLSSLLRIIVPDGIPMALTLGNHEFWGSTFEETLEKLKTQTETNRNLYFLDLIGGVEMSGANFVGGTLFFDGSMRYRDDQKITPWDGWNDGYITDIETRYQEFNRYYIDMITAKIKPGISTVLCTHHLPHESLNGHAPSRYNFYSGMKDLVHDLPFDMRFKNYLVCGHTHRRVIGEVVPGFMGVNVGSDYGRLQHYTVEC